MKLKNLILNLTEKKYLEFSNSPKALLSYISNLNFTDELSFPIYASYAEKIIPQWYSLRNKEE